MKKPKLKRYPVGGTKISNNDQYTSRVNSLGTMKNIPLDVATYTHDSLVAPMQDYQKQLTGALLKKYNLSDASQVTSKHILTPYEADQATNGKYNDYLDKDKAYENYRSHTYMSPRTSPQASVPSFDYSGAALPSYDSVQVNKFNPYVTNIQKHKHGGKHRQLKPKFSDFPPNGNYGTQFPDGGQVNPYSGDPVENASDQQSQNNLQQKQNFSKGIGYASTAINALGNIENIQNNPNMSHQQRDIASYNTGIDTVAGAATPWYGLAKQGEGIGKSFIAKDASGKPLTDSDRALNAAFTPVHEQVINDASKGKWGDAALSLFTGGISDDIMAYSDKSKTFAMGGQKPCYNCGGMKYPDGGYGPYKGYGIPKGVYPNGGHMIQYPDGGANAEVEKQEVMRSPNGETTQVNGPSHENGGVPVNIPVGTQIYSDRLKMPGTKKTFADLASKYKINKQTKILENPNATDVEKATAKLISDMKHQKLTELFNAQEQLKQDKVKNYANKLGVDLGEDDNSQFPNGGKYKNLSNNTDIVYPQDSSFNKSYDQDIELSNERKYKRDLQHYYNNISNSGMTEEEYFKTYPTEEQYKLHNKELGSTMFKKGGRFMGINPKHKGFCTPMTKPTCTGHRRALALTLKKHHGFHANGGIQYPSGGYSTPEGTFDQSGNMVAGPYGQDINQSIPSITNEDLQNRALDERGLQGNMNPGQYTPYVNKNKGFDYTQLIEPAANTLVQNLGNIAYLADQGKRYDKQQFYNYTPQYLDSTEAVRSAIRENAASRNALKENVGGNAGSYLSNLSQLQAGNSQNIAGIKEKFAQANAQIANQGSQFNIANRYQTDDINARNKGQALTNYYKALEGIGNNVSSAYRDYKAGKTDNNTVKLLSDAFSNYGLDINNPDHWKIFYKLPKK